MKNTLIDIVIGGVMDIVVGGVMDIVMDIVVGGDVVWGHELRACPPHF